MKTNLVIVSVMVMTGLTNSHQMCLFQRPQNENSQEHSSDIHLSFLINCQSLPVKVLQSYSFHFCYKVDL